MSLLNRLRSVPAIEAGLRSARALAGNTGSPLRIPGDSPAARVESTPPRFSNGLREFFRLFESIGYGHVLDVGPFRPTTVNYLIGHGFGGYTAEDVLSTWHELVLVEEEARRIPSVRGRAARASCVARVDRLLASNLRYAPGAFDAILLWDLLDYLDRDAVPRVVERFSELLQPGGAILAIFHTRLPVKFHRYRILDLQHMGLVPAATLVNPQHVYENREIQEIFECFHTSKTFVGRDHLREGVFVK
jgi:hypothetical protein